MTISATRKLKLTVSFDVDQIGTELVWSVVHDDAEHQNAYQHTGRHAGALHFLQGDVVSFEVVATGRPGNFDSFGVTDATLITLPAAYQRNVVTPSPFDAEHATFDLDKFFPALCEEVAGSQPPLRRCVARCETQQVVVQEKGIWKLSMVLTLRISRKAADGTPTQELRVFSFDPQAQVGHDIP
jgi:hypothetical protein